MSAKHRSFTKNEFIQSFLGLCKLKNKQDKANNLSVAQRYRSIIGLLNRFSRRAILTKLVWQKAWAFVLISAILIGTSPVAPQIINEDFGQWHQRIAIGGNIDGV